jgi:putative hydrolase of the HAD superfamily
VALFTQNLPPLKREGVILEEISYPLNIVFDIGNVICEWNPQKLVNSVFSNAEEQNRALANIIMHHDWLLLDKGTITLNDAIFRAVDRSGLHEKKVRELFKKTPESLLPFPETVALISTLEERRFNLFVLSNMHDYAFDYLFSTYSFWDKFSGIVISSSIKAVKPEPEIFQHLLQHHNLAAKETLFLDDMEVNVKAAEDHGIQTLLIEDPKTIQKTLFEQLNL